MASNALFAQLFVFAAHRCRDGYQGARCEYKMLAGFYTRKLTRLVVCVQPSPVLTHNASLSLSLSAHKEKLTLERASIAGGATMAVVLVVILSVIFYTYVRQRRKEQRLHG